MEEIEARVIVPKGRLGTAKLLGISAFWFATTFHWTALLMVILPHQVAQIAPDRKAQALGFIIGSGAVIAMLWPLIIGAWSDRCTSSWGRRRPFMIVGVPVNLLGLGILWREGDLQNFWLYLLGFWVVQLGNNSTASYTGVIPDLVPEDQRGESSGYMAAMNLLGTILGAFLSGYLVGAGYIKVCYLLIGFLLVFFLGITILSVEEEPLREKPPPFSWIAFLKSLWIDPRQHPDFAWVWITRALFTMGMWMVQEYLVYYLRDVIGVEEPERSIAHLLGIALIGALLTSLWGGKLSDRLGRKKIVYSANLLMAITALGFLFCRSLPVVYSLGILYGLGYGAYASVDWAMACDVLPNKNQIAKDMGVWHIAMVLPQTIAPPLAGVLLHHFGRTSPTPTGEVIRYSLEGYTVIFSLSAFFLLLSALFLRKVRGVR